MTQSELADAAFDVLREAGGELHKDAITHALEERGAVPDTSPKTRERVYNALWQECEKSYKRPSRFERGGNGVFRLSEHGRALAETAKPAKQSAMAKEITLPAALAGDGRMSITIQGGSPVFVVLPGGG